MSESLVLLDPTNETSAGTRRPAPRPEAPSGPVALMDINKARSDVFLDELERLLADRDMRVRRYRKPTIARPAPVDLRREIAEECDAVVVALAD